MKIGFKKSVSFPVALYEQAVKRQHALGYSTFSDYIQACVHIDVMSNSDHIRKVNPAFSTPSDLSMNDKPFLGNRFTVEEKEGPSPKPTTPSKS